MLGVVFVTAFGVWDAREAVADVLLERGGYTGRYFAQGVYRIRVENKAHLLASRSEGVHDRLGDQDLAQVADVDVAGGAYAGHRHVRPRSESLGDPFSPVRHRTTSANHALLHDINRGRRYHFEGRPAPSGPALARGLYVDDLVLGSATRRNDRYLISSAALEDGAPNRRRVGEFTAPGVRLVGPDNLEGPLLVLTDYPQGHAGAEIYRASLGAGRVQDFRVPQTPLDLADPALQNPLLGLGVVVLGVLRDVAELSGLPDAIRDLAPPDLREIFEFLLKLLESLLGEELLVLVRHNPGEYTSGQQRCQREKVV